MFEGVWVMFIVKFSLIQYEVYEIIHVYFGGLVYCIEKWTSDVGICRFLRSSILLVCMAPPYSCSNKYEGLTF